MKGLLVTSVVLTLALAWCCEASKCPKTNCVAEGVNCGQISTSEWSHCHVHDYYCSNLTGTCQKRLSVGKECGKEFYEPCKGYQYCEPETGVCADGDVGDACLGEGYCLRSEYCAKADPLQAIGHCKKYTKLKKDELCGFAEDSRCDLTSNLVCGSKSLKCVEYESVKDGEACSEDVQCQYGSLCVNFKCVSQVMTLDVGADCYDDILYPMCKKGLICVDGPNGHCASNTSKKDVGKECDSDVDCGPGAYCYCNDRTGTNVCFEYPISSDEWWEAAKEYVDCLGKKTIKKCTSKFLEFEEYFDPGMIFDECNVPNSAFRSIAPLFLFAALIAALF